MLANYERRLKSFFFGMEQRETGDIRRRGKWEGGSSGRDSSIEGREEKPQGFF